MKVMKLFVVALFLTLSCKGMTEGITVTDGFVSEIVRPSPDREDPNDCRRLFDVYLPPQFFNNPEETFPIVYHLTGLGGNNSTYSVPDRLEMNRMLQNGEIIPMIIVAPDPRVLNYDGSFWVDSLVVDNPDESFNNMFERYIVEELIPFVDQKYRQKRTEGGDAAPFRAIMGQSMGGYGSLYFGVKYPELFSAFAGDSPTSFWLVTTNLASPPEPPTFPEGNVMFAFNKFLIPGLAFTNPPGMITPQNNDITFGFYSWAGAFSPAVQGLGPEQCNFLTNPCLTSAPFCVDYPFVVNPPSNPELIATPDPSFVSVPEILQVWQQFDPYFLLDTADPEQLKRQAIYMDAGADLALEPLDNVGARFFSDKLSGVDVNSNPVPNGLDINHEYLLYDGGHVSCTTVSQLECYRFTTNLKLFSGKFSEAGIFAPDVRTTIVGDMIIELTGNSVMQIKDKALVGVETDPDNPTNPVTATNVTLRILDSARLEIGTEQTLGGGFQVGNAFGKANLIHDPSRITNTITFTLEINGPDATLEIGRQGFLGFGIGVDGNQTTVPNFWGLSTLTNVDTVTLNLIQGRLMHNQIASSLDPKGALLALGASQNGYSFNLSQDNFVIAGGANLASITEANRIHPTVQDTAGPINPNGIRNRIVETPATEFDTFFGPPKGIYASRTFSLNRMMVSILSSSLMLFDTNKEQLPTTATQAQLFEFLRVDPYKEQGRKRAPIAELDDDLIVGFTTKNGDPEMINRPVVNEQGSCRVLSDPFDADKVLDDGAVGIKIVTIDGKPEVIRVYDLDPDV